LIKISFDPAKRAATLADRDLDFADAVQVFAGLTFTQKDSRFSSWLFGPRVAPIATSFR